MLREAMAELDHLDRKLATTPEALRLRIEIHSTVNEWRAMRRCARLLVAQEPCDAQAWIHLAYATRRVVSIRAARRILLKATLLHPEEPIILFNLSCYDAQLHKLESAAHFLLKAIALNPDCQSLSLIDPDLEPLRILLERGLS
jgi:tetratricopeptide (TPR) repeat protein